MKKIKLIIVIISTIALLFSGCSSSNSKNSKNETSGNIISSGADLENMSENEKNSAKADETSSVADRETENDAKTENETKNETSNEDSQASKSAAVSGEITTKGEMTESPNPTVQETQKSTSGAEASTNKAFVKTETETTTETVDYKYGVKKLITYKKLYNVYSDGSKELVSSSDGSSKYDVSGYSATDQQLKAESDSKAAEYMSYYNEVLRLVNEIRAEVGADPLTLDTTLCKAATMRAVEMNYSDIFAHTRPDGRDCFSAFDFYGISYSSAGENIAAGYGTPQKVVEGWKNSEGHYKNMINSSYKKLGVGLSKEETGKYGYYWV